MYYVNNERKNNRMSKNQILDKVISICLDNSRSDKNKIFELMSFALKESGLEFTFETLNDNIIKELKK